MTATNGYILEGVSGVGKTRLLGTLQAELARRRPGCTKLVLSEHYTERILEADRARGIVEFGAALAHTQAVVGQIDGLFALKAGSPFRGRRGNATIYVLVERFIGSHAAHLWTAAGRQPTAGEAAAIRRQYATLADHGVIPLVLHTPPAALAGALATTRRHRNAAWSAYLDRLGGDTEVLAHFARWQEGLLHFYAEVVETPVVRRQIDEPGTQDWAALAAELIEAMEPRGRGDH